MNNQFCMKPNVQMYLTWLLVSLFHSVFGSSFVSHGSMKKTDVPKTWASFLSVRSALRLLIATGRLVLSDKKSDPSLSNSHGGFSSLRIRSILPASTPQQFKAMQKSQTASRPAIYPLIQFFHVCIANIKSIMYQQLGIPGSVFPVEKE